MSESLGDSVGSLWRVYAWTEVNEGCESSVVRILEPYQRNFVSFYLRKVKFDVLRLGGTYDKACGAN
jgi:hypothetical protein